MAELHQVLNDKATVYTLAGGKAWKETGPSGQLMVYHYRSRPNDILVRWWKSDTSLAYQVSPGHLKSRGANAWVVRAFNMNCSPPVEEIIAIRFQHAESADKFKAHFEKVTARVFEEKRRRAAEAGGESAEVSGPTAIRAKSRAARPGPISARAAVRGADPYAVGSPRSLRQKTTGAGFSGGSTYSAGRGLSRPARDGGGGFPSTPTGTGIDVEDQWVCPRCNSLNRMTELMCITCYNPVPERPKIVKPMVPVGHTPLTSDLVDTLPSPRTVPVAKDWHCGVCTFRNLGGDARCQICGSPNTSLEPSDDEDGDSRSDTASIDADSPEEEDDGGYDLIQRMMKEKSGEADREARIRREMEEEMAERLEREKKMDDEFRIKMEEHEARMAELRQRQLEEEQRLKDLEVKRAAVEIGGDSASMVEDDEEDLSKVPGSWVCPICTLINMPTAAVCDACDSPKSMTDPFGIGGSMDDRSHQGKSRERSSSLHSATSLFETASLGSDVSPEELEHGSKLVRDYEMMMARYTRGSTTTGSSPSEIAAGAARDTVKRVTSADFDRVASDIQCYNDAPAAVFGTLKGVAKKLLREDEKYRSLDTTNPKVEQRLIGYEGVLDFLYLLGFEGDATGQKLVCHEKPTEDLIADALEVLNGYEQRLTGIAAMAAGVSAEEAATHAAMDEEDEELRRALAESAAAAAAVDGGMPDEEDSGDSMTVRQIILWSTHEKAKDYDTMETLFMCHREFTESLTLLTELRKRFFLELPTDMTDEKEIEQYTNTVIKPIQLNVIKTLRSWMKEYWENDFEGDEDMEFELRDWIKGMESKVKIHNWNGVLAQYVRADLKKYRKYGSKREIPVDYMKVEIPRKFSIYSLSKNELADQITLMDFRIFSAIHPRECLGQAWKKKDGREKSPNILKMIAQFNNLTKFVQIQILREKSLSNRGKALKRIIKMAERFHQSRNYNSLCAVFGALESAPIHRLKLAWEKVQPREKKLLEEYKVIFSRDYNHRVLRKIFRDSVGSSCIPHIGIFLQDLVFIDDSGDDSKKEENLNNRTMTNFSKLVRLAERIKKIQDFQRCPFTKIEEFPVVQRLLIEEFDKLKDITEDIIWDMSTEVKKQDERDKTRFF